ncbi:nicotinate-nucleotide--dimethylbenzimidazole phosphoribosyltransferase [Microlunatus elymi]|uniref:Nicotinate-nucleotide--dimethylbenzimidazole phosphoribosyltransferase n=1 Tax=Microlunatus elymi TaxID=2596828 RepID=A0A516Q1B6_9ACTN|nr:nicotinate-nucleotide--dimethylbenzimidazole phosphoribosyltransferase [Microlunatus elymi]QDP97225.1 nicotinate-nucleotide--dimethylbenzimidazole phosphoribosyltransferase [Microlunatus elymi]
MAIHTAPVPAPDMAAREAARRRLDQLAKPVGSLGILEDLAVWLAGCQRRCPPTVPQRVRAVVLAGDHGVARYGVSAYPREVTAAMVRAFVDGTAAATVLARQHQVELQIYDLGVDDDLDGVPEPLTRYKVRRSSGPLQLEDALTPADAEQAYQAGESIARELLADDAELIIIGDLGIGNTTPAACLIAAALGVGAEQVTGSGTGVRGAELAHKTDVIKAALDRVGDRAADPWQRLIAFGSADLVAAVAVMITTARAGVPILLDGLISVAEAITAEDLAPGTIAWCAAGHRSTEPGQQLALQKLGLRPILDASMRLGEGSGALAAVPLLRSAALLINRMSLLSDL